MTLNLAPVASTAYCVAAVLFNNRTHPSCNWWRWDTGRQMFSFQFLN